MGKTVLTKWFQNDATSPLANVILAFCLGVLWSPWGRGLFFLIVTIIVYEILFYIFTGGDPLYWQSDIRATVINAGVLGWIVGRQASGKNILEEGIPL